MDEQNNLNGQYGQNNPNGQYGQYGQNNPNGQYGQGSPNGQYGQNNPNGQYGQYGQGNNTGNSGGYYQDYTYNPQQYQAPPQQEDPGKANGLQIAALVLGILGIPGSCCYGIGFLFGIIGLILALVGNKRNKSGIGVAGLACSIVAIVLGSLMVIYYILVAVGMFYGAGPFAEMYDTYQDMLNSLY